MIRRVLPLALVLLSLAVPSAAQHSTARLWNEVLLDAIRSDFARPTVHARNLFHLSVAQYDAWAAYDGGASPYVLGEGMAGVACPFERTALTDEPGGDQTAMSYAAYRLLVHRFADSPGIRRTAPSIAAAARATGVDPTRTSTDYGLGAPELGNYLAHCLIEGGLRDGSNESEGYGNRFYTPRNDPLRIQLPGNPTLTDPNRWQPLTLTTFVDQSGNPIDRNTPDFIGAEWGSVLPFALRADDRVVRSRGDHFYTLYHDPGPPPLMDARSSEPDASAGYSSGFELVARWSAHLDPSDGVLWDISPGALGNLGALPASDSDAALFYHRDGTTPGVGHPLNPHTGAPYAPQIVARGDYTRVLAEFWADGPSSETPPGHWFVLLNDVSDRLNSKRIEGMGSNLDALEWDVKSYLALGGAMHDAAIAAWGIKGWYDYVRPVSALRAMATRGQRSEPSAPDYHPHGLVLEPGFAHRIASGDSLAGDNGEHVGKIKVWAWRGTETDPLDLRWLDSGVGWVRAEEWWPYQRPSFVTPPFAGYVSGHSTFSRAAAEVLTLLTGDPFFPGGLGEYVIPRDTFLVFESGPSVDLTLQWATYRDAADQCSLSRIWGGIHPPGDDLPGRRIGEVVGTAAFRAAQRLFDGQGVRSESALDHLVARPSPSRAGQTVHLAHDAQTPVDVIIVDALGRVVARRSFEPSEPAAFSTRGWAAGLYLARVTAAGRAATTSFVVIGAR